MFLALVIVFSILAGQAANATDADFERFRWKKRLLLIFAGESTDPLFNSLVDEITAQRNEVDERDLVVFEILESGPSKMNGGEIGSQKAVSIRKQFEIPQNTFAVILVGKDGGIKLKRNDHVQLEDIFRLIDSMPMRLDEMRQKGLNGAPATGSPSPIRMISLRTIKSRSLPSSLDSNHRTRSV